MIIAGNIVIAAVAKTAVIGRHAVANDLMFPNHGVGELQNSDFQPPKPGLIPGWVQTFTGVLCCVKNQRHNGFHE